MEWWVTDSRGHGTSCGILRDWGIYSLLRNEGWMISVNDSSGESSYHHNEGWGWNIAASFVLIEKIEGSLSALVVS